MSSLLLLLAIGAGCYWLWAWAKKKSAPIRPMQDVKAVPTSTPAETGEILKGDGSFWMSVNGTAHQTANFRLLFGDAIKRARAELLDPVEEGDTEVTEAAVSLELEDSNPHDANAVRVAIAGHTVGYMPAKLAPAFRRMLKQTKRHGRSFRCLAEVEMPLYPAEDGFGVKLDLPTLKPFMKP